uniref:Enkurin domain-containing protein n=1 Tax=Callorhinchus milii TaxID=7868 RepID=A0A4W3JTA3_CALMI
MQNPSQQHRARYWQEWGPRPTGPDSCKVISETAEKSLKKIPDTFNARQSTDGCVCIKTIITPFEVREQELKQNFSLHSHNVKCFIPRPVLIRSKSAQCYGETPFHLKSEKIRPQTAVDDIIENHLAFPKDQQRSSVAPQGTKPTVSFDKLIVDKRPPMDPYRNRSGFYLRTLKEQKEYTERIAQSHSKSQEMETEQKDKASRQAWLRRVKGLPIEYFTKEGMLSAPELGSNSYI